MLADPLLLAPELDSQLAVWQRRARVIPLCLQVHSGEGKHSAASNSCNLRMRKAAFTPLHVEAFWIAKACELVGNRWTGMRG